MIWYWLFLACFIYDGHIRTWACELGRARAPITPHCVDQNSHVYKRTSWSKIYLLTRPQFNSVNFIFDLKRRPISHPTLFCLIWSRELEVAVCPSSDIVFCFCSKRLASRSSAADSRVGLRDQGRACLRSRTFQEVWNGQVVLFIELFRGGV